MKNTFKTSNNIFLCFLLPLMFFPLIVSVAPSFAQSEKNAEAPANTKVSSTIDILDLKNMDIADVLKLISQKSGLNIVAGNTVSGKITVYLKSVDVLDALRIIVSAYNWAYADSNGVIMVMTDKEYETRYGHKFGEEIQTRIKQLMFANVADLMATLNQIKSASGKIINDDKSNTIILMDTPKKIEEMEGIIKQIDVPTKTQVFDLNYAKAEELSGKISETLTPSMGKMKFDERSNKIYVTDSSRKIDEITKIVNAFDEKDRQVLIEAKIIQVVLSDEHKMGVNWEALVNWDEVVSQKHNLDLVSSFDILNTTDKKGKITIGSLATDNYTALVEALNTVGVTNILSSPRVMAVNNKEAKILVGSTEPYVTTTTTTPASGPSTTAESVNFIEVGVKLFVTPTIHDDDFITMKIKPEVSTVVKTITTGNNNTIPVVETSEAETVITVKNMTTVIIGGLIKEEKIQTTKKIPFLGNIPVLGNAFKNDSDLIRKTEIAIFLTPRIVSGSENMAVDETSP